MTQPNHLPSGGYGRSVADKLRFRERGALGIGAGFAIVGAMLVVKSANKIPGPLATYIAGVGCILAAVVMIIAWGAAAGHRELAEHATVEHQRLYVRIDGRVGIVETYEREQAELLGGLIDQVGDARKRRHHN
jgi:hypothetical protein